MAKKKCARCAYATGKSCRGTECNYAYHHNRTRTIQVYEMCGVDHPTEETRRLLDPRNCMFFEPGPRAKVKVDSVVLPGSIPHAKPKAPRHKPEYDWAKARDLHEEGASASAIAEALGCSESAVHMWRSREGLSNPKDKRKSCYDWELARHMLSEGSTSAAIAAALGCSVNAVTAWKHREGLARPAVDWLRGKELLEAGATPRLIAEELGCKERTVEDWIRREGLAWQLARAAPVSQ